MRHGDLKDFLEEQVNRYNAPEFVQDDPISVPHRFELTQDQEIAGFLAATIAWGNRKAILKSSARMLEYLDDSPFDFVKNFTAADLAKIPDGCVHRTFSTDDFKFFLQRFQHLYSQRESLETYFKPAGSETDYAAAIERFRTAFFETDPHHRSRKHISSPAKNSASKRILMFLRWMVRRDRRGVDLGIWDSLPQKYLSVPLDVHSGNIARQLGLLQRPQTDWKAVRELDGVLRGLDAEDPAKYDFALFGLGVSGQFDKLKPITEG